PGQYQDEETGLLQNWHRYYDAKLGRYLTPDTFAREEGFASNESIVLRSEDTEPYAYVGNDPVHWIDPEGEIRVRIFPSQSSLLCKVGLTPFFDSFRARIS